MDNTTTLSGLWDNEDLFHKKEEPKQEETSKVEELKVDEVPAEEPKKEAIADAKKEEPIATPADEEEVAPEEEIQEPVAFYKDVEQITGIELNVDYGDVDPLTPKGVAMREKALLDFAINKFEAHLEETNPKAYAYFLHKQRGGDDADFFRHIVNNELPSLDILRADVDMQVSLVIKDLVNKGVDSDIAETTAQKYVANNSITEKAEAIYNALQEAEMQKIEQIKQEEQQAQQQLELKTKEVNEALFHIIDKNHLSIVIPESTKGDFYQYVANNVHYDGEKFYIASELTPDNIKEIMESQFYQYKKGDLKSIVKNEVLAKTTYKLKSTIKKAQNAEKGGANVTNTNKDNISLQEIFNLGFNSFNN